MADSTKETFNVPPGFSVEEINGQLYHEDLEEDDELWLIRMPCDIELSVLDRQKIFLSSDTKGMCSRNLETENGRSLECYTENREISNTCVVLPQRQDGQLHAVKKVLKGTILISERLSLNNELEIKTEKEDSFSEPNSSSIIQSNGERATKKRKKSSCDLDKNDLEEKNESMHEEANISISEKKKSSKKKRHLPTDFDSSDLNYETEAAESTYSPKSQKKSSKKKKHSQTDFDSSDLNYETEAAESTYSPKSQKKSSKKKKHSQTDFDSSNLNYETEAAGSTYSPKSEKKSSKKKKHSQTDFDSSDLNCETEAAENTYSPKSQKKLSKHHNHGSSKKSSERKKIKGEPVSMNFDDEFPTCSSQKC